MTFLLFDLDGTLTATGISDVKCYRLAFERAFGVPLPSADWHTFTHSTDACIVGESLERQRGSGASAAEMDRFEEILVGVQREEFASNPADIVEVPGARRIIEHVLAEPGFSCGVATGGMRASALFKLSAIGIDASVLPGGFANDGYSRVEILECAIRNAKASIENTVYFGDAVWDAYTCAEMGLRLVGITHEYCEDRLREAGASVFLNSFEDMDAFYDAVRNATVPHKVEVH